MHCRADVTKMGEDDVPNGANADILVLNEKTRQPAGAFGIK